MVHKFTNSIKFCALEKLVEIEKVVDEMKHSFHSYAITGTKRREIEDDLNDIIGKVVTSLHEELIGAYGSSVDRDSIGKLYQKVRNNKRHYFVVAEFYKTMEVVDGGFYKTYERVEKVAELEISIELV